MAFHTVRVDGPIYNKIRFAPKKVEHNHLPIGTILGTWSITFFSRFFVFLLFVNYIFLRWFTTHPASIFVLSFTPALSLYLHRVVPECRSKTPPALLLKLSGQHSGNKHTEFDCPVFLHYIKLLRDSLVFWGMAHGQLPKIAPLLSAKNIGGIILPTCTEMIGIGCGVTSLITIAQV